MHIKAAAVFLAMLALAGCASSGDTGESAIKQGEKGLPQRLDSGFAGIIGSAYPMPAPVHIQADAYSSEQTHISPFQIEEFYDTGSFWLAVNTNGGGYGYVEKSYVEPLNSIKASAVGEGPIHARLRADRDSPSIGTISKGGTAYVLAEDGDWAAVVLSRPVGSANIAYVEKALLDYEGEPPYKSVLLAQDVRLALYFGPTMSECPEAIIKKGSNAIVLESQGDWSRLAAPMPDCPAPVGWAYGNDFAPAAKPLSVKAALAGFKGANSFFPSLSK